MDTIYALASARGKSGVAVIRISGPEAPDALRALSGRLPPPRQAALMSLRDTAGTLLDKALCLSFPAGASFTGEDVVELQCHGSRAVIDAVLRALGTLPGLRLAEPGEFTRRALENERMDLTEVEGLADLIEAETESQRRQALRLLDGALGGLAERCRTALLRAMALIEVTLDFADEEVPEDVRPEVLSLIDDVLLGLRSEIAGQSAAERIRDGFEVAIVGRPNVGKSTLLNALARRDAALTSDVAGTTRDVIEVRMDLHGLPVTFLDTAGLRETEDRVESLGIDRAVSRAARADLRVFLMDGEASNLITPQADDLVLRAKADLGEDRDLPGVSGLTGFGVDAVLRAIAERLEARASAAGTAVHHRHRVALERAVEALESARCEIEIGADRAELASEHLRRAARDLDALVGRVDVESVLDEIFRNFCLGK